MTVSSFTTVTLSPEPVVSFNVKVPSRTFSALTARQVFRILILSGNAAGARVADAFTKGSPEAGFQALTEQGMYVTFQDKKPWAPTIRGPGILMALDCELLPDKCISVGDHAVVLAKVARIRPGQAEHKDADADAWINGHEATQRVRGLVYGNRAYRTIGPSIHLSQQDEPLARKPAAKELTRMQDARNLVMAALRNDRVFEHMPRYTVYKLLRYAFGVWLCRRGLAQPRKVKVKEPGLRIWKHGSRAPVFRTIGTGYPDEGPDVGGQARYREGDVEDVAGQWRAAGSGAEEGAEVAMKEEAQQDAQPSDWSFEDLERDLPPEARFNLMDDEPGSEEAETAQAARNDIKSKELDQRPDQSSKVTRERKAWGSFSKEATG
ncbi:hypothetical protein H2199_002307 [Coniosporium tulheliwenetii]|uniref:Uncharacterized protein n=1 Tax=Coniosporium tulheliwenetii TaxID=3383036 RepID=A0ACC2ZIF7_9PEZI|nr:hypothetical protein H2199_002307 [Cladosporium sp. JES 115]